MERETLDLSRREFMAVGTTSMLALPDGELQQIKPQLQGGETATGETDFAGVADLLGPENARPEPGSAFFEDKVFNGYRYEATDTGNRYFITNPYSEWIQLNMAIDKYGTPYNALKIAQQATQFAHDPSKGLTRRRYQWWSNNTLFDSTLFTDNAAEGSIDIDTGGATSDTARLQSSLAGQYLSQSLAEPGVGVDIADANVSIDGDGMVSLSHGTVAAGVGWHDNSTGGWGVGGPVQTFLGIVYTSSGADIHLIANGSHLGDSPVPQSEWNLDQMDGSESNDNPSGEQLRPQDGYVMQFPYTWYGHGALFVGIQDRSEEELLLFHKFNLDRQSFDRPNMPVLSIVDDGGVSSSLGAQFGGMQYALYGSELGSEVSEERGLDTTRTEFTVNTASVDAGNGVDPIGEPGDPVLAFQRQSGIRDLAVRLESVSAQLDQPIWIFTWDEYEPSTALTGANFRNPNEAIHPDDETKMLIDTEATDYTPSEAVSRGIDYIFTDKNQPSLQLLGTDDRVPIDATRVITAAHDGTASDVDPFQVRIVEGY